ncbi:MAG TPA: M18 family aminopeptidase [Clostridiaceae bacterium]|nr:M18 family aminopeptidase [Clostridiaceae bacterium]
MKQNRRRIDKCKQYADSLIKFINQSPTSYQAVETIKNTLLEHNYLPYKPNQTTQLQTGDRYFYVKDDSAIIAFEIGVNPLSEGFKIFGAHTDSPALRIKPHSISIKENVIRLNTEVYGGPILSTWFDRPLSLAGRVTIKGQEQFHPETRLIDFQKPILILPNVAIHMNREVNRGVEIKADQHLLPFIAICDQQDLNRNWFEQLIAEQLYLEPDHILDYDLFLYDTTPGCIVGINQDFISASRLDNLGMCFSGLNAMINLTPEHEFNGINVLLYTNNEEVGSLSKQGARGMFQRDILESICLNLGGTRQDFLNIFDHSVMISADQAHAVHPNYSEYADPDHRPKINGGPVIKLAAALSYATDSKSAGFFIELCQAADIPYQRFVNRSDLKGGSTIGSIVSAIMPLSTVDIGNAIWAMHSIRETGGVKDIYYLDQVLKLFFSI